MDEYIKNLNDEDKKELHYCETESKSRFRFGNVMESKRIKTVNILIIIRSKWMLLEVDVVKNNIMLLIRRSKFEWMLDSIRIGKISSVPIWPNFFFHVSALLEVRHCPNLQFCAISRETNDATLRKWQKTLISEPIWGA